MKKTVFFLAVITFATAAFGQELQVNEDEWNSLSDADKQTIEQLMNQSFKGDQLQITPTPDYPASTQEAAAFLQGSPFCRPLCDIVAAGAMLACGGLAGPAAAICVTLASQARQICYARCDAN